MWSGDRESSLFDLTTYCAFPSPVGRRLTGVSFSVAFPDPSIISLSPTYHTLAAVARWVYFDFRSPTTEIIRCDCRVTIYNNKSSSKFAFTTRAIIYTSYNAQSWTRLTDVRSAGFNNCASWGESAESLKYHKSTNENHTCC